MADSEYQLPSLTAGAYKIPLAGAAGTIDPAFVADASVTLAKMADIASPSFIARASGIGTGVPQALTSAQAAAILPAFTSGANNPGVKGLVPAPVLGNVNHVLRGDGTWGVPPGVVRTCSFTYVTPDAAGSTGTDNTAATLKTIVVPANTLTQVGDRLRVRTYWRGDTGPAITGDVELNGVHLSHTTDGGAANLQLNEIYLHYIDNTHANIIEQELRALGPLSAVNLAGFDWDSDQNFTFAQNAVPGNRIFLYCVFFDIFPKGV